MLNMIKEFEKDNNHDHNNGMIYANLGTSFVSEQKQDMYTKFVS